jgi:hypothetical protein
MLTIKELTVVNTLPAEMCAVTVETLTRIRELISAVSMLKIDSPEAMAKGNELFLEIDRLAKGISEERMKHSRPFDVLKGKLIDAEKAATEPLLAAKREAGEKLLAYKREQDRIRREAEAAAAKAEQERRAAEARAEVERLEAEARAKPEADLPPGIEDTAPAPEPLAPVPPPAPAPVVVVPPPVKSAALSMKKKRLKITDANLIPSTVGGVRILVPDERSIERLLRAGVAVPGCILEEYEVIGVGRYDDGR